MPRFEKATLGGGCFWCLDAAFRQVKGIETSIAGFAGGTAPDPTYEKVCGGGTGHAEVVQLEFDPAVITYADVLDLFWAMHNPTTLNRQGNDVGTQYRSIILYHNGQQKTLAEKSKTEAAKLWPDPIVTEIKPLERFYPAEEYHQNYFSKNPTQAYCQLVINPKLEKLREKYAARLKPLGS